MTIVALLGTLFCLLVLMLCLKRGSIAVPGGDISRAELPTLYWLAIGLIVFLTTSCLLIACFVSTAR